MKIIELSEVWCQHKKCQMEWGSKKKQKNKHGWAAKKEKVEGKNLIINDVNKVSGDGGKCNFIMLINLRAPLCRSCIMAITTRRDGTTNWNAKQYRHLLVVAPSASLTYHRPYGFSQPCSFYMANNHDMVRVDAFHQKVAMINPQSVILGGPERAGLWI